MYTLSKEVREWLSDYKTLKDEEFYTYSQTIRSKHQLINALASLFEDGLDSEWPGPVCHQLYNFFKSGEIELKRFVLDLVPLIMWVYLSAISRAEKRKCHGLESLLLGVYNLEIVDEDGMPKVTKYTIPTLAVPSVYHEPPSLATIALTESALFRYHSEDATSVTTAPKPPYETINAQNRLQVLTYVISVYNADIGHMSERSHKSYCRLCSKLCRTGFDHLDDYQTGLVAVNLNDSHSSSSSKGSKRGVVFAKDQPRVPLSSEFMVELLTGLYFVVFNGEARQGVEALERMHMRASYELYAPVLLLTNAIRNSLQANPSGQPQDGPMGISIALSPAQRDEAFSKHAITNASFRTKKLPEDIDIVPGDEAEAPPHYDDVIDPEKATTSTAEKIKSKLASNPLRSIMKRNSEKDQKKIARKESDSKRRSDIISESNSPKSPKHSMSTYSDIADPLHVQVAMGTGWDSIDETDIRSRPSTSNEEWYHTDTFDNVESDIGLPSADNHGVVIRVEAHQIQDKTQTSDELEVSKHSSNSSLNTAL